MSKKIFVFVRGGVVVDVRNSNGSEATNVEIIDHDNEEGGNCPVCSAEFDPDAPCSECGYSQEKDNALEAARAYYGG